MPSVGPAELIIVLALALIVFGPKKLPELGKSLGRGLHEFRSSVANPSESLVDGGDKGPSADADAAGTQQSDSVNRA